MYYVGVDIGGTAIKAGLVNENGKIVKKSSIETKATRKYEEVLNDIIAQVKELTKGYEVAGVGIGCPGTINSSGVVEYANNLYWKNVPLAEYVGKALNIPCKASNDANVAALGEVKFGAGKNYSDAVMVTLGTGVGAGFILDGKLFEGFKGMGAEGGHTVIRENGVSCTCGRKGCLEAYASATALIRETLYAMMTDKNSLMWEECGGDLNKVDGRTSFEAAKKGDKTAQEVVDGYAKALAEGILNFVNVFRSQIIILGGGVCAQGEALLAPVRRHVDEYRYGGHDSPKSNIIVATLGNDAGIIGAASLFI